MNRERVQLTYAVRRLYRNGESIRGISRALGISRKLVRKLLAEVAARREGGDDALRGALPARRAPKGSKLDAHREQIEKLLESYPDLKATRLHEILRDDHGFDGGYTIVREYLNRVRAKPPPRPDIPVVTSPGKQGQFDWSPYKLADGSVFNAFSCVLSFSRYQYLALTQDTTQATTLRHLRRAMELHEGVAGEYVTDSMPGIVDRWELNRPVLNIRAVDFAAFYDFTWHIAPRGSGKYKGKVERPFRYFEESFLNGRTFYTLEQAQEALVVWMESHLHVRLVRALGKRGPRAVWASEERAALAPLPLHRWDDRELAHRIVDGYGHVDFETNHYRAPGVAPGAYVYVRASDTEVALYDDAAQHLATHPRAPRGGNAWVPPPVTDRRPSRRPVKELVDSFALWSTAAHRFAAALRERRHYAGVHLEKILALRERYSADDILAAIAHAERYQAFDAAAVERVLALDATPRTLQDQLAERARARIQKLKGHSPIRQRGMQEYGRLLHAEHAPGSPSITPVAPEETAPDALGQDHEPQTQNQSQSQLPDQDHAPASAPQEARRREDPTPSPPAPPED